MPRLDLRMLSPNWSGAISTPSIRRRCGRSTAIHISLRTSPKPFSLDWDDLRSARLFLLDSKLFGPLPILLRRLNFSQRLSHLRSILESPVIVRIAAEQASVVFLGK